MCRSSEWSTFLATSPWWAPLTSATCKYERDRGMPVLGCLPSILIGVKVEGKRHTADGYMQMLFDFPASTVPEGETRD